ncbi:MAG: RimK family alpha-L-glutamate ligase [Nitrospinaceae bacterium]
MGDIKDDIVRVGDGSSLIQDIRSYREKTSQNIFSPFDTRKREVGIEGDKAHSLTAHLSDFHQNDQPASPVQNQSRHVLGIIEEFDNNHLPYVAACKELGVRYKIIDISGPDGIQVVRDCGCNAFLTWPSFKVSIWKRMFDERLKVMAEEMHQTIYPTCNEMWLNESKLRMSYWLEANGIPHCRTWVFYTRGEALEFAQNADLPLVAKCDMGSRSAGVEILRSRSAAVRYVLQRFGKGMVCRGADDRDREWGSVFFQEFLPEAAEWRMIRIDESYFGHQKLKGGEFHSGSGKVGWLDPPRTLLDFVRELTDNAGYTAMNVDIFETPDGRYLVNEIQSHFAAYLESQMYINDRPGRYLYDYSDGEWRFEEGVFCRNSCCNLRVKALLKLLRQRAFPSSFREERLPSPSR